jgi:hypothetical protein
LFSSALISWPDTTATSLVIVTRRLDNQGVAESHVYSSQDQGLSWNRTTAVPNSSRISGLYSSHIPNKFYLVGKQAIYMTAGGGVSFTRIITSGSDILEFSLHPTRSDVFTYSTAGQLHLAFGDGDTVRDLLDTRSAYLVQSDWLVLTNTDVRLVAQYRHPQTQTVGVFKYTLQAASSSQLPLLLPTDASILPNSLLVLDANVFVLTSVAGAQTWLWAAGDLNTFKRVATPPSRRLTMLAANSDVLHFALEDAAGRDFLYAWDNSQPNPNPVQVLTLLNCFGARCDLVCSELVLGLCLANQMGADMSLRTTNGGGSWEQLTIQDSVICGDGGSCPLRLLMDAAQAVNRLQFAPTGFSDAASYLVFGLATTQRRTTVSVVSNDGGSTWMRSSSMVFQHQAVDHGSVLLLSDVYNPRASVGATNLSYSVDEGRTFTSIQVTKEPIHMIALVSHPGETSATAIVMGYDVNGTDNDLRWVVLGIGFEEALGRNCTAADFSLWGLAGTQCNNGVRQQFHRRKPDVVCRIGSEFKVAAAVQVCNCTRQDYECAEQFTLVDGECVAESTACSAEAVPRYSRTLLNRCQGGLALDLDRVSLPNCPDPSDSSTGRQGSAFNVVLIAFGAIAATAIVAVLIAKYLRTRGSNSPRPVAFVNPVYDRNDGVDAVEENGNANGAGPGEAHNALPAYDQNDDDDAGYIEVQGLSS